SCTTPSTLEENYLMWGLSGQGKTFFIDQIAETQDLIEGEGYIKLNLAASGITKQSLTAELEACKKGERTKLVLIDEIDALSTESWPYESIFESLQWNMTKPDSTGPNCVFVLAGSKLPD